MDNQLTSKDMTGEAICMFILGFAFVFSTDLFSMLKLKIKIVHNNPCCGKVYCIGRLAYFPAYKKILLINK